MIGKSISHYRVTEKLGEGGMGVVYRATDTKLGRDVALKVLPPVFANDSERMALFKQEAHVLASLNHPPIASIYSMDRKRPTASTVLSWSWSKGQLWPRESRKVQFLWKSR